MFILHGGQVTGPFDPNDVAAKATSRSIPADAMMGPTAEGPWMPVYAVATPRSARIGILPGLAIIVVGSVVFTAFLVWMSSGKKTEPVQAPAVTVAPVESAPEPAAPTRRAPTPGCDADKEWKGEAAAKAFEATVRSWSPECRRAAMVSLCDDGCHEVVSDHVLAAAPADESKSLRAYRLERNSAALSEGRAVFARVDEFLKYALALERMFS